MTKYDYALQVFRTHTVSVIALFASYCVLYNARVAFRTVCVLDDKH